MAIFISYGTAWMANQTHSKPALPTCFHQKSYGAISQLCVCQNYQFYPEVHTQKHKSPLQWCRAIQQTRDFHPMLSWCWSTVCDAALTLNEHWADVGLTLNYQSSGQSTVLLSGSPIKPGEPAGLSRRSRWQCELKTRHVWQTPSWHSLPYRF